MGVCLIECSNLIFYSPDEIKQNLNIRNTE